MKRDEHASLDTASPPRRDILTSEMRRCFLRDIRHNKRISIPAHAIHAAERAYMPRLALMIMPMGSLTRTSMTAGARLIR